MATVSICMIVKNEEQVLARCLDSLAGLAEEIIIVDTGSTDQTREIAARYTEHVYDFAWTGDFSEARNFAFSKATQEYIYSADADEVIDEENRTAFRILKENLMPEIDIVQMIYANQLANGSVYNFDRELRPKLFKRLRTFRWSDPIHEQVVLEPLVFDSDVVITHMPTANHKDRDLQAFAKMAEAGKPLSARLYDMYARELYMTGTEEQLQAAAPYFASVCTGASEERTEEDVQKACCVLVKNARLRQDMTALLKYALLGMGFGGCSELACELGAFFLEKKDAEEALMWYAGAAGDLECLLSIHHGGDLAFQGMAECYRMLGDRKKAEECLQRAEAWRTKQLEGENP